MIPIYKVTAGDCTNLRAFIDRVQYETPMGICKIILPKGTTSLPAPADVYAVRCRRPIRQTALGKDGWHRFQLRPKKTCSAQEIYDKSGPLVGDDYWSTIRTRTPLYGADTPGTLMRGKTLGALFPSAIDGIRALQGINTPFLYAGSSGSTFAWHCEDLDMFSANYHCFGHPKVWYTFSRADNGKFEALLRKKYAADARKCPEFIRHKVYMTDPNLLRGQGIEVHQIKQQPGEIIVTFSRGYHAGYNIGPNMAEAINFVTASWAPVGQRAGRCECHANTVSLDAGDLTFAEDEVYAKGQLYCLCQQPWTAEHSMIQCDRCDRWYHHRCLGMPENDDPAEYTCVACASS